MASAQKLPNALNMATRASTTPYVCTGCRSIFRSRPSTGASNASRQLRYSSSQHEPLPFTEKIRRKIWGTDNPPGLKDPYGGPSFLERARDRRRQAAAQEGFASEPPVDENSVLALRQTLPAPPQSPTRGPHTTMAVNRADSRLGLQQSSRYDLADTWEGLEWVGQVKEDASTHVATHADQYQPWLNPASRESMDEAQLLDALHESIFDVIAPPEDPYDRDVVIQSTGNGFVLQTETTAGENPTDAFANARLRLQDTNAQAYETTFKILKNLQQVTSVRIADPVLNKLAHNPKATYRDLLKTIVDAQKPKPTKVAEKLLTSETLASQPNVVIQGRRITPIDKEKEVGRWKLIEKELVQRGLPLPGEARSKRTADAAYR